MNSQTIDDYFSQNDLLPAASERLSGINDLLMGSQHMASRRGYQKERKRGKRYQQAAAAGQPYTLDRLGAARPMMFRGASRDQGHTINPA